MARRRGGHERTRGGDKLREETRRREGERTNGGRRQKDKRGKQEGDSEEATKTRAGVAEGTG